MSDFIVSIGKKYRGDNLLNLLKRPYSERAPEGRSFDFPWGSAAILQDRIADNNNIVTKNGVTFGWVGDLVTDMSGKILESFLLRIETLMADHSGKIDFLKTDEYFSMLNGAFAIIVLHNKGFSIVTDPLNYTQVYIDRKEGHTISTIGTHPDLVASVSDNLSILDISSLGEYLNSGRATFPNTMYLNVKQLEPGSLYIVSVQKNDVEIASSKYWSPPGELEDPINQNDLAEELRYDFLSAVRERSVGRRVAVSLSGGLDSRLIIASVPKEVDCIGLTFCDELNRETKTAHKLADCYNRSWYPLYRDKEYVANNAVKTIMLTGCESDWVHAHAVGFAETISSYGIGAVLGGDLVGCYLRAPLAADFKRAKRMGGMLPHKYEKVGYDYVGRVTDFARWYLANDIVEQVRARRKDFYERNFDARRSSIAEWLEVYPFSQRPEISTWAAQRRVLPSRPVGMDRRLLDIGFKTPVNLKLDDRMFVLAAKDIYGDGLRIPNANDGVRPGSGHWGYLLQRAIRKLQDRTDNVLEKLGKEKKIQHSWHDYQKYWKESKFIKEMIEEYGANLKKLEGILFVGSGKDLLRSEDLFWRDGFRLLQLAVWLGIKENYPLVPQ